MQSSQELSLTDVLAEEVVQSKLLLDILEQERSALQATQIDELDAAIAKKIAATEALYGLERKRAAILALHGLSFNAAGMTDCLRKQNDSASATKLWEELLDFTRKCQYQNRLNGAVVQSAQRRTQGLIGLLRGETKTTSTYCANGKEGAFSVSQRSLGSV